MQPVFAAVQEYARVFGMMAPVQTPPRPPARQSAPETPEILSQLQLRDNVLAQELLNSLDDDGRNDFKNALVLAADLGRVALLHIKLDGDHVIPEQFHNSYIHPDEGEIEKDRIMSDFLVYFSLKATRNEETGQDPPTFAEAMKILGKHKIGAEKVTEQDVSVLIAYLKTAEFLDAIEAVTVITEVVRSRFNGDDLKLAQAHDQIVSSIEMSSRLTSFQRRALGELVPRRIFRSRRLGTGRTTTRREFKITLDREAAKNAVAAVEGLEDADAKLYLTKPLKPNP